MPRPPSPATATIALIAVCGAAWSCDAASRSTGDQATGGPARETTSTSHAIVPEPAIGWRPAMYAARHVDRAPLIDGSLDDPVWQSAAWTTDFIDIRGGSIPSPRYRTRARVLWDDENLYVGAELEEPHVWGTLTERDAVIYHDNDFEVFVDPDADTHLYYELEINALGTVWDLMLIKPYRDGGPAIDAWDIGGLRTGVAVDGTLNDPSDEDRGWTAEIAIPWGVLAEAAARPAPPDPGDRWRINFSRVQWASTVEEGRYVKRTDPDTGEVLPEDNWVWSPQGLVAMHYPEMWGIVEFVGPDHPGGAPVALTESEKALWALRHVYYRQRERADREGSWARDAAALELGSPPVAGVSWPPSIWLTPSGFEATLPLSDGRAAHIREDGLTWLTD